MNDPTIAVTSLQLERMVKDTGRCPFCAFDTEKDAHYWDRCLKKIPCKERNYNYLCTRPMGHSGPCVCCALGPSPNMSHHDMANNGAQLRELTSAFVELPEQTEQTLEL